MTQEGPVSIGPVVWANSAKFGEQSAARLAARPGGGYVVVWVNWEAQGEGVTAAPDNDAAEIRMRLFDASGSPSGEEILVNGATRGWQQAPQVAVLADGRIAVAWTDGWDFFGGYEHQGSLGVGGATGDASGKAVKAQLFSAAGAAIGSEILVNTTVASDQQRPSIVALDNGGFLVAWEDWSLSCNEFGCGGGPGIKAQVFGAGGGAVGSELAWSGNWCFSPTPVALAGGGFAAVWLDAYYYDPASLRVRVHDAGGGWTTADWCWPGRTATRPPATAPAAPSRPRSSLPTAASSAPPSSSTR